MNRALIFLSVLVLTAAAANAQQTATVYNTSQAHLDLAGGYQYTRANAPPSDCNCFNMQGGFGEVAINFSHGFGVAGRFTIGHASDISNLGQDLTLMTYMGGPRFTWHASRLAPYGDFLVGGARGSGSFFPTSSGASDTATSFAYAAGGGIDFRLTDRISLRAIDGHFMRSSFPNAADNQQNHMQIAAGLVFHFGGGYEAPAHVSAPPPVPVQTQVNLRCWAVTPKIQPGDVIRITGQSFTVPDGMPLKYAWTTTGGTVQGQGSNITVDTVGLAPGQYSVEGHAYLVSDPSIGASCHANFEVDRPEASAAHEPIVPPAPLETSGPRYDDFKAHVTDTFFDYDQSSIRPDAQIAVAHDAAYLIAHPDMDITIAGYADERGSAEYNIALGLSRAESTRDALAKAGVSMSRMQVLSYGKEKPFCTEEVESCFQLNRRGQLLLNAK